MKKPIRFLCLNEGNIRRPYWPVLVFTSEMFYLAIWFRGAYRRLYIPF